jgi:hypothetical protein
MLGPTETRELIRPVEQDSRVCALAIFGSVARGEARPTSDIDLLVVHDGPMPDDLDDALPRMVTMAFYTPARLAALPERSPLFAAHLASEGLLVRDQAGLLERTLNGVRPLDARTVSRVAAATLRRFDELVGQPRGLHLNPIAAAAELYALGKQSAMLLGAAEGRYTFNRHRALEDAYATLSLPAADRRRVDGLEELWHAARTGNDDPAAPGDLEAAAAAVCRLLIAPAR